MYVGRILRHKDRLPAFIMGDHGLRARHDAPQHGDRARVHRPPAPRGDHVPIDRDDLPHLLRYQRRQQGLVSPDALQLPKKLAQRCAVIAPAKQGPERMLAGIEPREPVDTQQGGKKQRLPATQKRRLPVMQQRTVIARMRLLIDLYRLRELRHYRVKGVLVVEPMGKHMHTDA